MIKSYLNINDKEAFLKHVEGKVFHATSEANVESIFKEMEIIPNSKLAKNFIFGNVSNGYFRNRGCVSFFDYRCYGSTEWNKHAYKCFPTSGINLCKTISILFLCESQYSKLLPWSNWKKDEAWGDRIVPHVEAGYPGKVSIRHITEHLVVHHGYS